MTTSRRWVHAGLVALAAAALVLGTPRLVRAQQHVHEAGTGNAARIRIPESMKVEHRAIHAELEHATRAPGRVGASARALAGVLHPHFIREEQIALPPLGLLVSLSRGESASGMRDVLPMTDSLDAELPRMLDEHRAIGVATRKLLADARAAGNARVVRLAEQLALHAQTEEEVFYPAAVLVGGLVRARAGAKPSP